MNTTIQINYPGAEQQARPFPGLMAHQSTQIENDAKAEWNRNPSIRAEFCGDFGAYSSFQKAKHAGLVKISGGRHV